MKLLHVMKIVRHFVEAIELIAKAEFLFLVAKDVIKVNTPDYTSYDLEL